MSELKENSNLSSLNLDGLQNLREKYGLDLKIRSTSKPINNLLSDLMLSDATFNSSSTLNKEFDRNFDRGDFDRDIYDRTTFDRGENYE